MIFKPDYLNGLFFTVSHSKIFFHQMIMKEGIVNMKSQLDRNSEI